METWSAEGGIGKEGAASLGRPGRDPPRWGTAGGPGGGERHITAARPSGGLHSVWALGALPGEASRGTFSPGLPVLAGASTRVNQPSPQTTGIKNSHCPLGMWGGGVT